MSGPPGICFLLCPVNLTGVVSPRTLCVTRSFIARLIHIAINHMKLRIAFQEGIALAYCIDVLYIEAESPIRP